MRRSVFINYRIADSYGTASRFASELKRTLKDTNDEWVFLDKGAIKPGEEWPATIESRLEESEMLCVLIGDRWLGASLPNHQRRIDQHDDWVRREIATAFDQGKTVLPVYIDHASPLTPDANLKTDIEKLVKVQGARLRTDDWLNQF